MSTLTLGKSNYKIILTDIFALMFIYFIPVFSHLFSFPIYYIEPMRIGVFIGILFTNRMNVFALAFSLPLFSFIVSAHPVFLKTLLISGELLINAYLFYFLSKKSSLFISIFVSVLISKIVYYLFKLILIQSVLLKSNLISTPLEIQLGMVIITTLIFGLLLKKYSTKV